MKKLLLVLLAVSSVAYADECAQNAQKAVDKLHKYNKTAVQFNYSPDKVDFAKMCQADIATLDKNITVKMNPVSGTGQFKMQKPD